MGKRGVRIVISVIVIVFITALTIILDIISGRLRHSLTCNKLEVKIEDTSRINFVKVKDIKSLIIQKYGTYIGKRIESIDLKKIENILDAGSAIQKSEAYTTSDGVLHIVITQRKPLILFQTPAKSYYCDEKGFLFPLQPGFKEKITIVRGKVPLFVVNSYKAQDRSNTDRIWIKGIINLVNYIKDEKIWRGGFKYIDIENNGDISLNPVKGKEKFIIGNTENIEDKFSKIEDYYKYIVPSKEEGYYTYVNVKYKGRIICRKKE